MANTKRHPSFPCIHTPTCSLIPRRHPSASDIGSVSATIFHPPSLLAGHLYFLSSTIHHPPSTIHPLARVHISARVFRYRSPPTSSSPLMSCRRALHPVSFHRPQFSTSARGVLFVPHFSSTLGGSLRGTREGFGSRAFHFTRSDCARTARMVSSCSMWHVHPVCRLLGIRRKKSM